MTPNIMLDSGAYSAWKSKADVDIDEYIPNANVTAATPAIYWAATGDWITAKLLMTNVAPTVITPANSTVPCIGVLGAASMAAGYARVFMQITEVPFL